MTKHEIREVFIHSIAEQYKNHGELIPPWLHIGDIEFEEEEQEPTDKNFTKADIDAIVKAINTHWELIIDEIRAEIETEKLEDSSNFCIKAHNIAVDGVLQILDKYKAETEDT